MAADECLITGYATRPHTARPLRAGPLWMTYIDADVRYLRLAGHEVLRRICAAVRDEQWETVPGSLRDLKIDRAADRFEIRFISEHRRSDLYFVWHGEINGDAQGTLRFALVGEALSTFRTNRIGCCVLHPRECAGKSCRVTHGDGMVKDAVFPREITAEQPLHGFHDVSSIAHQVAPDVWLEVTFHGDTFETEDQRNWLDASFKTYSTPLCTPVPIEVERGQQIQQTVIVRIDNPAGHRIEGADMPVKKTRRPVRISISKGAARPLPKLGLVAAASQHAKAADCDGLRALHLSHLRYDIDLSERRALHELRSQFASYEPLGVPIELGLYWPHSGSSSFADLQPLLESLPLARVLVLQRGSTSTPPAAARAVTELLRIERIPVGVGTSGDVFEINIDRPLAAADFLFWSMNPQWHASDNRTMAENVETVDDQVQCMRRLYGTLPLVVSPITLKPRAFPGPGIPFAGTQGLVDVDPRQRSLFGASWTLAMIARLARAHVSSATFYETLGPRGIMSSDADQDVARNPQDFVAYPCYFAFKAFAGFTSSRQANSSSPLTVAATVIYNRDRERLLIANLSDEPQVIEIRRESGSYELRRLDEHSVATAMYAPESFWREPDELLTGRNGRLRLKCERCGIIRLDRL